MVELEYTTEGKDLTLYTHEGKIVLQWGEVHIVLEPDQAASLGQMLLDKAANLGAGH